MASWFELFCLLFPRKRRFPLLWRIQQIFIFIFKLHVVASVNIVQAQKLIIQLGQNLLHVLLLFLILNLPRINNFLVLNFSFQQLVAHVFNVTGFYSFAFRFKHIVRALSAHHSLVFVKHLAFSHVLDSIILMMLLQSNSFIPYLVAPVGNIVIERKQIDSLRIFGFNKWLERW